METIRDDDILEDDERVSIERRAATTRWWGGLASLEVFALVLVCGLLNLDFTPPVIEDWRVRVGGNLEQVARAIRLIGDGSEATADVLEPPIGVDPFVALTLLVTLGIATTVALGSSLDRLERARAQFLSTEKPTAAAVFQVRNAEMGQAATFVVTMLALVLAHGMVAASFVSMTHSGEVSRHLSWVVAVASLVMAVFFLVESARLSATAFRSPLRTQPPGGDRAVAARLARGLAKWARKQPPGVPVTDGPVAGRRRRQLWLLARRFVAGAVMVMPCAWLLIPSLLGAGGPEASARVTPPTIILVGIGLLAILGYLAARMCADSLRERRAMRWMTLLGASLMYWLGALAVTAAVVLQISEEGVWRAGPVRAGIVGLLWLALVVMLYERVLGWAALGSRRDLGLRIIVETCSASPPRWKRYAGAGAWSKRCGLIGTSLGVQIGLALLSVLPVVTNRGSEALLMMAILVLGVGLAATGLAAVAASEFGRPEGAHRILGVGTWHEERVWQIVVVGLLVLTISLAQIGRGAAGMWIVPWAAVNVALLVGVLCLLPTTTSWIGERCWRWISRRMQSRASLRQGMVWLREKLQTLGGQELAATIRRGMMWSRKALRTLGDQLLAARIRRRRRWIARGIAPDGAWDDKQSMDWVRSIVTSAQMQLGGDPVADE